MTSNIKIKFLLLSIAFCCFGYALNGQNNTSSPYSFNGIGEIEQSYFTKQRGMSGLGVATFSNNNYSLLNPASIGFINKSVFDFGLRADRTTFDKDGNFRDIDNGNFNNIALGFSMLKKQKFSKADTSAETGRITGVTATKNIFNWSAGFAFTPFASKGGNFGFSKDTFGSSLSFQNVGSGGLSNLAFQNGFQIGEYLAIGHSFSVIWGQNFQTRNIYDDSFALISLSDINSSRFNGFANTFGAGLNLPLSSKLVLNMGASLRLQTEFNRNASRIALSVDERGARRLVDTLLLSENVQDKVGIPASLALGASLAYKGVFLIGVDYIAQNWSEMNGSGWADNYTDYNRLCVGLTLNHESNPSKSMRKPEIYLGYATTKLQVPYSDFSGNILPVSETGMSFGLGLPVLRDIFNADGKRERYKSMIHITGEYINRGANQSGFINEKLYRLSIGLSLTDLWFMKRKYR